MADSIKLRRHYPGTEPRTLTVYQIISLLIQIDPALAGPVLHVAVIPKPKT